MSIDFTIIENVEIEFFHGIEEDGDYCTSSFIYPPCQFLNSDAVTIADTVYRKDAVYVRAKDDGALSNLNPIDGKRVPIPFRAIVSVKRRDDGTLYAGNITIVDGDMSIIAAHSGHGPSVSVPGHPSREDSHEMRGLKYIHPPPGRHTPSPHRHRQE